MSDTLTNNQSLKSVQAGTASGEFPSPIAELLGLRLLNAADGKSIIEFEANARFANPMGTLHGGVLCDLADLAMGAAYRSALKEGETFTTLELKINFLRPVWNAVLRAEGAIVNAGRTVGLVECEIRDERGRMVARASSTCMTLRGQSASGR
jgi:uncharacterized protein (TIGR00369 family)